tara:strand:+ start:679 stop:879 length:201 start_codon:yes stop_codon:yes gene_type:complete
MKPVFTFSDLVSLAESINLNDEAAKNQWRDMFHVYNTALNNPPLGVIGVGAITYAEQALVAFQKES